MATAPLRCRFWPGNLLLPALIALATTGLFLPMLVCPAWGLLDDVSGIRLATHPAQLLKFFESSGRYFPVFWLWTKGLFDLFGYAPAGHWWHQALIASAANLLLFFVVRSLTGWSFLGIVSAVFFTTASPWSENYCTLAKAEPRLVLLLLISLYFLVKADHQLRAGRSSRWWLAGNALILCAAYHTKEIAVLMCPVSLLWAVVMYLTEYRLGVRRNTKVAFLYFCLNAGAFVVLLLSACVWKRVTAVSGGAYTGAHFGLSVNWESLGEFYVKAWEIVVLCGFGAVLLVSPFFWRVVRGPMGAYAVLCWFFGLAYFGFFVLCWRSAQVYYLLPAAAGIALAVPLTAGAFSEGRGGRWTVWALVLLAATTRVYSVPSAFNSATALFGCHQANTEMVRRVSALPKHSRLLLNYPEEHQYHDEIRIQLEDLYGRDDIRISYLFPADGSLVQPRENDYILLNTGLESDRLAHARCTVAATRESMDAWLEHSTCGLEIENAFEVWRAGTLFMPFSFKPLPYGIGWTCRRIRQHPVAAVATYSSCWLGHETNVWLAPGKGPVQIALGGQSIWRQSASYPLYMELREYLPAGVRRWMTIKLEREGAFQWTGTVDRAETKPMCLTVLADRVFSPLALGIGGDPRPHSVLLANVSVTAPSR